MLFRLLVLSCLCLAGCGGDTKTDNANQQGAAKSKTPPPANIKHTPSP